MTSLEGCKGRMGYRLCTSRKLYLYITVAHASNGECLHNTLEYLGVIYYDFPKKIVYFWQNVVSLKGDDQYSIYYSLSITNEQQIDRTEINKD